VYCATDFDGKASHFAKLCNTHYTIDAFCDQYAINGGVRFIVDNGIRRIRRVGKSANMDRQNLSFYTKHIL